MAVRMRKVLAIPRSSVVWPMQFKLGFSIKSTVLIHVCQPKGFLVGLFSGELISEGLIIGGNFSCVEKWVGLENKNGQQHKVHDLIFGRVYYRPYIQEWAYFCFIFICFVF